MEAAGAATGGTAPQERVMRVGNKCEGLAFHPLGPEAPRVAGGGGAARGLLAIATSNLTGQLWSGLLTLAPLPHSGTSAPTHQLHTDAGNGAVAFAGSKGEWLVAGSDEGSVLLWHTAKPAKEGSDVVLSEHDDIVSSVAAHQGHLLSGSWDHKIKLWDVTKTGSLATFEAHIGAVYAVQFVSASQFVSGGQDKTVKLWDGRQASVAHSLRRQYAVCALSVSSHDDHLLALGEEDGSASVFDLRNLSQGPLFTHNTGDSVRALSFSPLVASRLAVASDDTTLTVLDVKSQRTIASYADHTDYVRAVAWDPCDASSLASGGWDGLVYFHTLPSSA